MAVFKTMEDMEPPANPMAFWRSQVSLHWEWQQQGYPGSAMWRSWGALGEVQF